MALMQFSFFSQALQKSTSINIALPEFEDKYQEPFKNVWMLHGLSGNHTDWQRKSGIERHASSRGVAVIMPDAGNSFYADMAYGDAYFTYLTNELPEYLHRLLPLSDKREDRFIGGLSMGGYGAMKIGLTFPERFAAIACLSAYNIPEDFSWQAPSQPEEWKRMMRIVFGDLFPDDMMGSPHDLYYLADNVCKKGLPKPAIYHVWGDMDVARRGSLITSKYFKDLKDGFRYYCAEYPGYHDFDFWDARLPEMFEFFGLPVINPCKLVPKK
ncbi:MAG: hypothetical protein IKE62_01890 [Oscillospiraceae bacterium]|nr:hypothetical protein [Oscillospiraceae bacterium]